MKISKDFINYSGEVPIIGISLDGVSCKAILDSGAEPNIVDEKYYLANKDKFQTEQSDSFGSFIGLEGGSEHQFKNVFANLTLKNKHTVKAPFSIVNMGEVNKHLEPSFGIEIDMLLGSEFLKQTGAVIDYEKQKVTFNNDLSCK